MTTPSAQGGFYQVVFEQRFLFRSARLRLMRCLAPRSLPPSSISCSTKISQTISAICFENTSAFRFKTAHSNSNSPSPILPLRCSIFVKTGALDSSLYDEERYKKIDQLDKTLSVLDLSEVFLLKGFISLIFFKTKSLFE